MSERQVMLRGEDTGRRVLLTALLLAAAAALLEAWAPGTLRSILCETGSMLARIRDHLLRILLSLGEAARDLIR
ncbi:MAG: hypothetical protein JXP48_06880 [Acidobacteria bacterium]|nr:hypothetical protein [Acidobacteriota bacterium]